MGKGWKRTKETKKTRNNLNNNEISELPPRSYTNNSPPCKATSDPVLETCQPRRHAVEMCALAVIAIAVVVTATELLQPLDRTSFVELSSGLAAQSRHHLRTVQTTAEGTPFSGSMNATLCDF